jgi:hypothetical protein
MVRRLAAVGRASIIGLLLMAVGMLGGPVVTPGVVELSALVAGRSTAPVPFDRLLLDVVSAAGLGGYLGLVGSVALAVALTVPTARRRPSPRLPVRAGGGAAVRWMALVAGVCGIGIAVTPVGSLAAGGRGAHHDDPPTLTGLPMPGLPAAGATPSAHRHAPAGPVLVRPGDTLWQIAADRLPDTASDGRITNAVNRWYDRNRSVIGPDADLIFPGTRLEPPGGTS